VLHRAALCEAAGAKDCPLAGKTPRVVQKAMVRLAVRGAFTWGRIAAPKKPEITQSQPHCPKSSDTVAPSGPTLDFHSMRFPSGRRIDSLIVDHATDGR
jgi:hypothetical protein